MPAERKGHVLARIRRHDRTYREPGLRDVAAGEVRLYAALLDPAVAVGERRRAAGQWLGALRELGVLARRVRGGDVFSSVPGPERRSRNGGDVFRAPRVPVPAVVEAEPQDVAGEHEVFSAPTVTRGPVVGVDDDGDGDVDEGTDEGAA